MHSKPSKAMEKAAKDFKAAKDMAKGVKKAETWAKKK